MSENRATGGAGTGRTDAGTTRDTTASDNQGGNNQGLSTTGQGGSTGAGTGTAAATGLAATAKEYGGKIADAATTAASTAKDYMTDKASVVTDKIKDLSNRDFSEVANEAKEYARKNPGQAILISAAAGLVLGLLIRSSRR